MNVLFLSYWGAGDGLTRSTVVPHVEILGDLPFVSSVVLVTIERGGDGAARVELPKVLHVPFRSKNLGLNLATKAGDVVRFGRSVVKLVLEHDVHALICRTSLAGSLGLVAHAATGVPLFVESFEPHVDYAVEAGSWTRYGARATFLRASERLQIRFASGIMPVARWYSDRLVERGVAAERIRVVPCAVPLDRFAFSERDRARVRAELSLGANPVGIYVGKFGDFYYDREAFTLFRDCFDALEGLRLIVLTPTDRGHVEARLRASGIDPRRVHVDSVGHDEVPRFLSAADFAFALYPPSPSKRALSPIKNGEYWANGLPVLLTRGVGDEAEFLESEGAGALLEADLSNPTTALERVMNILSDPGHRKRIAGVAARYRSFDSARAAYRDFLTPLAAAGHPHSS